jgi:hypothetical protein
MVFIWDPSSGTLLFFGRENHLHLKNTCPRKSRWSTALKAFQFLSSVLLQTPVLRLEE